MSGIFFINLKSKRMYAKNNTNIEICLINFVCLLFNIMSRSCLILSPLTLFYIQRVRYDLEEAVATHRPLKKCHVISRDHKPDAVRNGFATLNWLWHEIVQFENIFRFAPEFYMDFSL